MEHDPKTKAPGESANPDMQEDWRGLVFSLGNEEYSVPFSNVKEVIEIPEITPVPKTPSHFLGIMNLRGQVISVIDLRLKLKKVRHEPTPLSAVIILDFGAFCVGTIVSSVNRVLHLRREDIKARPMIESADRIDYILGIAQKDSKLILLLDIAKALDVAEKSLITQNSKAA